jgi:hypothetical protein
VVLQAVAVLSLNASKEQQMQHCEERPLTRHENGKRKAAAGAYWPGVDKFYSPSGGVRSYRLHYPGSRGVSRVWQAGHVP